MSTLRVNNLQNTSTTDGGISIDNSGHVTVDGVAMPSAGPLSNRNLIINGAMQVAQRGTSSTASGYQTVDRFLTDVVRQDELTFTVSQDTDAPAGFTKSFKWTTGTAETAIAADEYVSLYQKIEGQNLQQLQYGASTGQSITMSFWVKSSQTGTFSFTIYRDETQDRIVNKTYTIDSANTWEYKTITIAADTSDAVTDDNAARWWNVWHLAAGSNYDSATSDTWANYTTTNWAGGHAQDGVITTASATWQITGVQLEVGSVATPFEHRSYGDELARCQRYFEVARPNSWVAVKYSSSNSYGLCHTFVVEKRAAPSVTPPSSSILAHGSGQNSYNTASVTTAEIDTRSYSNYINRGAYSSYFCLIASGEVFTFDAEL